MIYPKIKRLGDIILSLFGLIVLSPFFLITVILIKIDSPGPAIFWQKRIAANKTEFKMAKWRTMKINSPKNTPTHQLENPEKYITRCGKIFRRISWDESIQIIHILSGKMSIIGPRPALWNQYDLIEERDKYGANDVRPGLTEYSYVNRADVPMSECEGS